MEDKEDKEIYFTPRIRKESMKEKIIEMDTRTRIKILKHKLNSDISEKERTKILNLFDRVAQGFETRTELNNWFNDIMEMTNER